MTERRIAVVGSGVSGMTAGYVLSHSDDVTLFEADDRLGGHAHTHLSCRPRDADRRRHRVHRPQRAHLPAAHRLFARARGRDPALRDEHVGPLRRVRPRVRGPARPARPGRRAAPGTRPLPADAHRGPAVPPRPPARLLDTGDPRELTLGEFLRTGGFSRYFTAHFAVPLVAAVWSCPTGTALRYPARYLFAFLANHGMLSVSGSPPWRTVTGGSRSYVERAAKGLARHPAVHPGARGAPLRRRRRGARRRPTRRTGFDAVVVATHPDQALRLLDPPTDAGTRGARRVRLLPEPSRAAHRRLAAARAAPGARASWNYLLATATPDHGRAAHQLRHEPAAGPRRAASDYVVTLGGADRIDPRRCIARMDYAHPVYTPAVGRRAAPPARARTTSVIAFAGAYHGWGFHEDGCRSGVGRGPGAGGHLVTAPLYEGAISHARTAPLRNAFRYRTYLWLVDLDHAAPAGSGRWPASTPATTSATRRPASGPTSTRFLADHGRRPGRRPGADARPRPGARLRVQPADRVLVPPARRHAGLRGRRGAQHLRRAARLPAAPRRARPGRGAEGVLRLAVLPGRRPLPDEPARAGGAHSRSASCCTARTGTRFIASVRGRPSRPPPGRVLRRRRPASLVHRGTVAARIRWQGVQLYLRGLRVVPPGRGSSTSRRGFSDQHEHA